MILFQKWRLENQKPPGAYSIVRKPPFKEKNSSNKPAIFVVFITIPPPPPLPPKKIKNRPRDTFHICLTPKTKQEFIASIPKNTLNLQIDT